MIQFSKDFWCSIFGMAIRAVFDFSITSFRLLKRVPIVVFWLDQTDKSRRGTYQANSVAFGWYSFRFWLKLAGNNGIAWRCVIMVQNPKIVYPQILSSWIAQASHNAQIVLLADCLIFRQKFMMRDAVVIYENLRFRLKTWFF